MKKILILFLSIDLCGCQMSQSQESIHLNDVKVLEVESDRFLVETNEEPFGQDQIYILLSSQTQFVNVKQKDIQVGNHLEVELDVAVMRSLPAQVNTFKVTLIK